MTQAHRTDARLCDPTSRPWHRGIARTTTQSGGGTDFLLGRSDRGRERERRAKSYVPRYVTGQEVRPALPSRAPGIQAEVPSCCPRVCGRERTCVRGHVSRLPRRARPVLSQLVLRTQLRHPTKRCAVTRTQNHGDPPSNRKEAIAWTHDRKTSRRETKPLAASTALGLSRQNAMTLSQSASGSGRCQ